VLKTYSRGPLKPRGLEQLHLLHQCKSGPYKVSLRCNVYNILKSRLPQIETSRLNKLLTVRCRLLRARFYLKTLEFCAENSIYDKNILIRVRRSKLHPSADICDQFLQAFILEQRNRIIIYENQISQLIDTEKNLSIWLTD
jgi:hypothetical protein